LLPQRRLFGSRRRGTAALPLQFIRAKYPGQLYDFLMARNATSTGQYSRRAGVGRRTPSKGVHISLRRPNWVFLTVCTENREGWLAQPAVQASLHSIWKDNATAWLVSDFLLMPDHVHLFCAPYDLEFTIERWIGYWKDRFAKANPALNVLQQSNKETIKIGRFQSGGFHHRLRSGESYKQKWQYVRENPMRAGLAANPDDWPYQGRVHQIRWQAGHR
jgi:putative transposase